MKVVILAGGRGSRISFYTQKIPKPMIKIGNTPILTHIMRIFKFYGFNEFIIAAGYKENVIRKFYRNKKEFPNIKIVNTGLDTMTGGRLLKLKKLLKNEDNFFVTYGDGVSNINLKKLLIYHKKHKRIATVLAVRPPVKFGELMLGKNSVVKNFVEKPQIDKGWINGGFFIFKNKIFNYLNNSKDVLEKLPMIKLTKKNQLVAFKNTGYWRCMDNLNEKNQLEEIYKKYNTIWKFK